MPEFTYALDLPPGIDSDNTTYSAKGRWADGNNVRFVNGRPQSIGGYANVSGTMTGICRAILMFNAGYSGGANVTKSAYATDSKLYIALPAISLTDITPTSGWTSTSRHISLATWGTDLLAAPSGSTLFQSVASATAAPISQAPAQITRMLVAPQRQVLAFGCNEVGSGTFNNRCIRGCDLETLTDWTPSAINSSFEDVLDDHGAIVAAELIGPYAAVWTETSLYLGQFIGDPSQTWRWDKQADVAGPMSTGSVTVSRGVAYWMGADRRFYMWAPGAPPEQIPCTILRDMVQNFSLTYRNSAFAGCSSQFDEVWFFYPDARDGATTFATRYLARNNTDGTWFRGTLRRSAMFDGAGLPIANFRNSLVMAEPAGSTSVIDQHELRGDGILASWPDWFLQSADQCLDDGRRRVGLKGVVPDFEQQAANVSLTLFLLDRPQSESVTGGPYTLTPGAEKLDFRKSGMLVSVKLSSPGMANTTGNVMRLGRITFPCLTMGER